MKYATRKYVLSLVEHILKLEKTMTNQAHALVNHEARIKQLETDLQNASKCFDDAIKAIDTLTGNMDVMADALANEGLIYFKDQAVNSTH